MKIKQKRGIRAKISNLVLTSTIVIFSITITVISITNRKASLKDAFLLTDTYAHQYANEVKAYLDEYMDAARIISSIYEGKDKYPINSRRHIFMSILQDVLIDSPHFLAAWTIWEPNAVDGLDSLFILKPGCTYKGNLSSTFYRDNDQIKLENSGASGELFVGSYYNIPKTTRKETLLNPNVYSYTGDKKDEILQTNMIVPIIVNNTFLGVTGIDAELESFKKIVEKIKPYEDGQAFILANDGSFVAHSNEKNIGVSFAEYAPQIEKEYNITRKIKKGESFSIKLNDEKGKFYYSFAPIYVGKSPTPWSLAVVVPYKSVLATVNRDIFASSIIGLIGIIILAIILNFVSSRISKPLMEISKEMQKLNAADVKKLETIAQTEQNEIGNIASSSNSLINWINRTGDFAKSIGDGDFAYDYKLFNGNDLLGKSLLEMRDELKNAQEETLKREIENKRRTWAAQGLAKMNDIIRKNSDDQENLYYHIISNLVQYIEANQGGIFITETDQDDQKVLELKASYAYDRRKYIKKTVYFHEGLLGECAMGKEKIILSEIPDNYVQITSGLGGSNPKFLILVPLIFNEKVFGVVEIASFNEIEPYKYEFVESVSETIASTISMIYTNMRTKALFEH